MNQSMRKLRNEPSEIGFKGQGRWGGLLGGRWKLSKQLSSATYNQQRLSCIGGVHVRRNFLLFFSQDELTSMLCCHVAINGPQLEERLSMPQTVDHSIQYI